MTICRIKIRQVASAILTTAIMLLFISCSSSEKKCNQSQLIAKLNAFGEDSVKHAFLVNENSGYHLHKRLDDLEFQDCIKDDSYLISNASKILDFKSICEGASTSGFDTMSVIFITTDKQKTLTSELIQQSNIILKDLYTGLQLRVDSIIDKSNLVNCSYSHARNICDYIHNNHFKKNSIVVIFCEGNSFYHKCRSSRQEFIILDSDQYSPRLLVHEILHKYLFEVTNTTYARKDNIMYSRFPECEKVSITTRQLYHIATRNKGKGKSIANEHLFYQPKCDSL